MNPMNLMNLRFLRGFMLRLDKLLQVLPSRPLWRALLRHRVLGAAEHRSVLRYGFATVVDIGANRGQFTLAVRRWSPSARVFAFEPLPAPAAVFRRVFAGVPRITLHQVAIGPQACRSQMHVSAADDSSSLLPITERCTRLFPGTDEIGREQVLVGRLADFVCADQIVASALLKLDVQGFELAALQGCEELLPRFCQLYIECSFIELYTGQPLAHEIVSWLKDRGFALDGVYNVAYDQQGKAVQADLLFQARRFPCPK